MKSENTTRLLVALFAFGIIVAGFLWYWYVGSGKTKNPIDQIFGEKTVVEESAQIPETTAVHSVDIRTPGSNGYAVPIVPEKKSDEVVISGNAISLKDGYALADTRARVWTSDAKLVVVKSLATVDLAGTSLGWQVVFGSLSKKKGYEVIVNNGEVMGAKEIILDAPGADVPKRWYEVKDGIASLQTLPQFKGATLSGVVFFYNADDKAWRYSFETSKGGTSMIVR